MLHHNIFFALLGCLLLRSTVFVESNDGSSFVQLKGSADGSQSEGSQSDDATPASVLARLRGQEESESARKGHSKVRSKVRKVRADKSGSGLFDYGSRHSKVPAGLLGRRSGRHSKVPAGLLDYGSQESQSEESQSEGSQSDDATPASVLARLRGQGGQGGQGYQEESQSVRKGHSKGRRSGDFQDPSQGPLQASILAGPSVDLHGDVQLCRETQLTSMYFTLKETLNKVADGVDKMDTDLIQRLLEKEGFEVVDDVLKRTREAMKDYIKQVDNIFTTAADIEDAAEAKKQTIGALTKLFLDERIQDLLKDDCASSNAVASSVNVLVDFKKALEGGPDALVRFHNRHSELHKPDVVGRLAAQKKIEERQKKLAKANDKEVEFLQNRVASLQQQLDEATSKLAEKQSDGLGIEERLEGIQELACKQTGQYLGEAKDFICASYSQVNHLLSQNDANCRDAREKAKMLERMFLKAQLNLAKIHSDTPFEDRDDIGWKVEVSKLKTTLQVTLEQLHHEIQIIKQKCADMPPSLSGHLNTMALLMLEVSQQFNLGLTEDLYYFCVNWTMLGKRCSTGDFEGLSKKYRKAKHFKPDGSGFYHLRKTNAGAVDGGQHGYRGAAKPTRKGKARRKQAKRGRH